MPFHLMHDYQRVIDLYATHTVDQIAQVLGFKSRNVVSGIINRARLKGMAVPQKSRFVLINDRLTPEQREERRQALIAYHTKRRAEHPELYRDRKRQARRRPLTQLDVVVASATAKGMKPRCTMDPDLFKTFGHDKVYRDHFKRAQARRDAAPPEPVPLLLSLFDMSDAKCHWIHGDRGEPGYGYCGHATDGESAYCAHHHALMHPVERRTSHGVTFKRHTRPASYV